MNTRWREEETAGRLLGRRIAELSSLLERLEDERREAESQAMTSGHSLRQMESEMTRVSERLATYQHELRRVAESGADRSSMEGKAPALVGTKRSRRRWKPRCRRRGLLRGASATAGRSGAGGHGGARRLGHAGRAAARCQQVAQRLEAMAAEVAAHLAGLRTQLESAAAEKQQRESENLRLAEQSVAWTAEREQAQQRDRRLGDDLQACASGWRNWRNR